MCRYLKISGWRHIIHYRPCVKEVRGGRDIFIFAPQQNQQNSVVCASGQVDSISSISFIMELRYLSVVWVASSFLAAPATSFGVCNNVVSRTTQISSTSLHASSGPGYKIGANSEGILINNRYVVDELAKVVPKDMDMSEMDLLRFALVDNDKREVEKTLKSAIKWRQTTGKHIVDAAREAVTKATANGGWDNEHVRNAAPHAAVINKYITPKAVITTSTEDGDLVYVIRASQVSTKFISSFNTDVYIL